MWFFLSLYLQQVLGYSPIRAGLAFLPMTLCIVAGSTLASRVVTRVGAKPLLVAGMALLARRACSCSRSSSPDGSYLGDVLVPSLLVAIGIGFAFVPVTIAAVSGVAPAGGRPGLGARQHLAAVRRRARAGDPGRDRHRADQRRRSITPRRMHAALTERVRSSPSGSPPRSRRPAR